MSLETQIDSALAGLRGDHRRGAGKRRHAPSRGPRGGVTEIESLLFPRAIWSEAQAKAWAKKHDKRYGDVDVTEEYIRLRQADPGRFRRMRTKCLERRKGRCVLKAVIGVR